MPGPTPYKQYSYPLPGETFDAAALATLAGQIDAAGVAVNSTLIPNATTRPAVLINLASSQSVPKAVETAAIFGAPGFDTTGSSMWNAGQPTRVVAPVAGLYQINCKLQLNGGTNTTTKVQLKLCKNGSTAAPNYVASSMSYATWAGIGGQITVVTHGMFALAAAEYVTASIYWLGSAAGPYTAITVALSMHLVAYP